MKKRNKIIEEEKSEKKYIFVDAKDIKRCKYEVKREQSFNDYDNIYYQTGYESIENIFNENNVPKEYQKVILELNDTLTNHFLGKNNIDELLTKSKFILTTVSYNEKDGGNIYGKTKSNSIDQAMFFNAKANFKKYNDVLQFLSELNNLNLIDNYFRSLVIFFRKDKNILKEENNQLKLKRK